MSRVFAIVKDMAFEVVASDPTATCGSCVVYPADSRFYNYCSSAKCGDGHFILADTESNEFLLAKLKGEVL